MKDGLHLLIIMMLVIGIRRTWTMIRIIALITIGPVLLAAVCAGLALHHGAPQ